MEPALKSFLDGIDENDNVVTLRAPATQAPKNDNEEPLQDGSGMLDMRELARRYREMVDHSDAKPEVDPPISTLLPNHILAPVVEQTSQTRPVVFIASIVMGALMLVCLTVVITVVSLRGATESAPSESTMALVSPDLALAEPMDEVVEPAVEESPEVVAEAVVPAPVEIEALVMPEAPPSPAPVALAPVAVKKTVRPEPVEEVAKPAPVAPAPVAAVVASVEEASAPVAAPAAATNKDAANCDEVACLLEGRACCDKAAPSAKVEESSVDQSRPTKLSRSDISSALVPVQGRLQSCGTRNEVTGAVTIKMQISAEGEVQSSKVGSGSEEFQSCVSQILQKAQFAQTQSGTTVSYPIILR